MLWCRPIHQFPYKNAHQNACPRSHVGCVLGRNDEAEVMAIFRTSRGECTAVGSVGSDIEHASIGSVSGRA
jgi:hypothetical protein